MIERIRTLVARQLDAAEKEQCCLVARTRADQDRLQKAVGEGMVIEVVPHIYARRTFWEELSTIRRTILKMKALQSLHPQWVFAGPSAACVYGLAVSNRYLDKIWFATTRKAHRCADEVARAIIVTHDEGSVIDGVRLTSFGRTVGDCLRIMDFRSGLAVADSALRVLCLQNDQLVTAVTESCERMGGINRARAVIRIADHLAESGGESIARATMLELGFAPPQLQRELCSPIDPSVSYRVDFSWELTGGIVLGELDGGEKYTNSEMRGRRSLAKVIDDEHRRQSHLEAKGDVLRMVRFGFADVMQEQSFCSLLVGCGIPRTYAMDDRVVAAGGMLRCR